MALAPDLLGPGADLSRLSLHGDEEAFTQRMPDKLGQWKARLPREPPDRRRAQPMIAVRAVVSAQHEAVGDEALEQVRETALPGPFVEEGRREVPIAHLQVSVGDSIRHLELEPGGIEDAAVQPNTLQVHEHLVEALGVQVAHRALVVQVQLGFGEIILEDLSLIHISEPTRLLSISYAVFC